MERRAKQTWRACPRRRGSPALPEPGRMPAPFLGLMVEMTVADMPATRHLNGTDVLCDSQPPRWPPRPLSWYPHLCWLPRHREGLNCTIRKVWQCATASSHPVLSGRLLSGESCSRHSSIWKEANHTTWASHQEAAAWPWPSLHKMAT